MHKAHGHACTHTTLPEIRRPLCCLPSSTAINCTHNIIIHPLVHGHHVDTSGSCISPHHAHACTQAASWSLLQRPLPIPCPPEALENAVLRVCSRWCPFMALRLPLWVLHKCVRVLVPNYRGRCDCYNCRHAYNRTHSPHSLGAQLPL